ncbi:hypothetical protein NESM_000619300 [Novymonas esmeraldas]|uniref:Uncharacterized protein n=1 Tax=Novymonas esmeraldas TaxID=1808958 RepID=A0AAW0ETD1_9TRYP
MHRCDSSSVPPSPGTGGDAAHEVPGTEPASSVLFTLLQDLGLTATAQALCQELQLQQQQQSQGTLLRPRAASLTTTSSAPSLTSRPSGVFTALSHVTTDAASPTFTGCLQAPPTRESTAAVPTIASTDSLPASAAATAGPAPRPAPHTLRGSPSSGPFSDGGAELQRRLQSYGSDTPCATALATLATWAVEPVLAVTSTTTSPSPLRVVDTLATLWRAEQRSAAPQRALASPTDDAAAATTGAASAARGQYHGNHHIAALIARAAWCELRLTELVFTQELHLSHAPVGTHTSSAHEAQREAADIAGQLVAALQELRVTCGAAAVARRPEPLAATEPASPTSAHDTVLAARIVSRLHTKAIAWLQNAECVLTWVLRRHSALEPLMDAAQAVSSAQQQQQQQHKRRCLETHATDVDVDGADTCSGVASPLVQPLRDALLGLHAGVGPAPTFQQCLAAEVARSAPPPPPPTATATTMTTTTAVAAGAAVREAPHLLTAVRIPTTVRVAMAVQRVKLFLSLLGALVHNGADSILCALVLGTADRVRPWWTRQSTVAAQLLVQCAHRLNGMLPPSLAHASTGALPTTPPPPPPPTVRPRPLSAAMEIGVVGLRDVLETLAREVLLCQCPLAVAAPLPPLTTQERRLALSVRLLSALEQAHNSRAARLDRHVLKATAAAAAMVSSSPLSAAADVAFSPASSVSSPTFGASGSGGSPVSSPLWTVRVPSPPGSDLRVAAEYFSSSALVHRGSMGSGVSSAGDPLEATRTATQVLQWRPHFTQLLATIATGRWQAPHHAPQAPYPGSRYNRLRVQLRGVLQNAQELLRLQPRQPVGVRGVVYPPHPAAASGGNDSATPRSVVEQLPRTLQLATLQSARVLEHQMPRRLARTARGERRRGCRVSGSGGVGRSAAVPPASSLSASRRSVATAKHDADSPAALLAAATATALRRASTASGAFTGAPVPEHADSERRRRTSASAAARAARASPSTSASSPTPPSSSDPSPALPDDVAEGDTAGDDSPPERWPLYSGDDEAAAEEDDEEEEEREDNTDADWATSGDDVPEEAEDEEEAVDDEEAEDDEAASDASSADMDYGRDEDAMQEEVECAEATPDGRLLALLTARGRLMVLRLQALDSVRHYEEEVLLDVALPHMPSRQTRLQWYEALASFVHFSPCHRFVLAAVQFTPVDQKPNSTCAMARAQLSCAGQVNVYSLHCHERRRCRLSSSGTGSADAAAEEEELDDDDESGSESNGGSAGDRLRRVVGPAPDRLYGTFHPHDGPCLSARWVDTRWWGGGRRSRWANSAAEPLNSTSAAAAALTRCMETGAAAGLTASQQQQQQQQHRKPKSWRAAAGALLSEYQCVSVGTDDVILRWLPACGVVLQRILTEPVHDIIVSPLMAALYVATDAGDLYMYDAWDERHVTDGEPARAGGADVCEVDGKSRASAVQTHRLILPVTEEGHPRFHRAAAAPPPSMQGVSHNLTAAAAPSPPTRSSRSQRHARRDHPDDSDAQEQVHSHRATAHYAGPVSPVFQRVVEPASTLPDASSSSSSSSRLRHHQQRRDDNTTTTPALDDVSDAVADEVDEERRDGRAPPQRGLPRHLRWLLPHQWAAHTPWDAQLGRRLIRHLLRQPQATAPANVGELVYEQDDEEAVVVAGSPPSLAAGDGEADEHEHDRAREGGGGASDGDSVGLPRHGGTTTTSDEDGSDREYAITNGVDYDDDDDGARRPLPSRVMAGAGGGAGPIASETTAAAEAAARGAPVSVLESAAHPTPARGPLQRAYYPSGACLVYKCIARALCSAGDLADRQTHDGMGPGGSTHHLLSMALSGVPQWTPAHRLWDDPDSDGPAATAAGERDEDDAGDGDDGDEAMAAALSWCPATRPTRWPTAALARVLLWRNYLSASRYLAGCTAEEWAAWESDVLATTYHADVHPQRGSAHRGSGAGGKATRWSASNLLAARGYHGAHDALRRCAPASQRGLAATARHGRYLCIMASVGPYRKLLNPREPLRDMPGLYACLVFDVYAGAVLRTIPVSPVELTGLRGRCMWASERHSSDPKAPIYRLPCTVSVVPLPATTHPATVTTAAAAAAAVAARSHSGLLSAVPGDDGVAAAAVPAAVEEEEEDGEPKEVVVLTVGGLGNAVYVFDALTGRRLAQVQETARCCGESAATAYEVSVLAAKARAKARGEHAASTSTPDHGAAAATLTGQVAAAEAAAVPPPPRPTAAVVVAAAASVAPAAVRKPSDVLASVAAWRRGTGFDGITDQSSTTSSTASSPDPSPSPAHETRIRGGDAAVAGETIPATTTAATTGESAAEAVAAAAAVSAAVAECGVPVPWLLQTTAPSQRLGWHLRGVLWWAHEHPQPSTLYGGPSTAAEARGGSDRASWGVDGEGSGAASTAASPPPPSHTAAAAHRSAGSALSFFCHTLLGVSGIAGRAAAPSRHPLQLVHNTTTRLSSTAGGDAAWRQRRRRLLERLLRHYDVGMLWQAYVSLFAAATTATGSLAPQSAVGTMMQWAQATNRTSTAAAAAALLGRPDGRRSWVWCAAPASHGAAPPRRVSAASTITTITTGASPRQPRAPGRRARRVSPPAHDVGDEDAEAGGRSRVPFAHVLQQREEFMAELLVLDAPEPPSAAAAVAPSARVSPAPSLACVPPKSLLAGVRAQAIVDGALSTTARARAAQQSRSSTATAAHGSATAGAPVRLPPSHHQNQLRVDVINCVATWLDANNGFYVCCGSEDGGLYILGGSLTE